MKSKVHFSIYCIIVTVAVIAALLICIAAAGSQTDKSIPLTGIAVIIILAGLFYCPVSVSVDSDCVRIRRLLAGNKTFKYSDIESVETCYPSAGGIRLCGSGGFFGYWGYFSDILIGQYFGYYADRSQCFCIKLKSKKQYVISCKKHIEIVKAIEKNLK